MESSRGATQEEIAKAQAQYEQRQQRLKEELRDRESALEKARQQLAELTRELVDASNESGAAKNEARKLRD